MIELGSTSVVDLSQLSRLLGGLRLFSRLVFCLWVLVHDSWASALGGWPLRSLLVEELLESRDFTILACDRVSSVDLLSCSDRSLESCSMSTALLTTVEITSH